ncbi:MAG TPA: GWxTD domain-containing protein [Candidatus Eisenbacteria bacterium]|nr:GWxTD domain-containing protein [Candidatus Eisenbacteria bacterium]
MLASPARALDLPPLRSQGPPFFTADLAISLDRDQRPGVSVSITVPYQELEWLRIEGPGGTMRYAGGIEFSVIFESPKSDSQAGDAWERRVVVAGFAQTRAPNAVVMDKRTFSLPPGRHRVRVAVRDLNSNQSSMVQEKLQIQDFSKMPVGFADLELGVTDSAGVFRPVANRNFGIDASRIAARASLFDRRSGSWPRRYSLQYKVRDESGEVVVDGRQEASLAASGDSVIVRPKAQELFLGSYVFEVELVEGKSHWRVDRSFEVDESGPPRGREFERMLEPLSYLATPQEMDWLRALPPEQQAAGWEEFWRRRDPTPETPRNEVQLEFFRRVRYAEHHFQGFGPGWRSDMGRIYIKFGPPDQIENRPATLTSPQQEIWYYHQPYRRLVFVDREGFGRYTLLNPAAE